MIGGNIQIYQIFEECDQANKEKKSFNLILFGGAELGLEFTDFH
jgi:hypothetical protein